MSCVSDEGIWKQAKGPSLRSKQFQEIKALLEKSKANTDKPLGADQRKLHRRTFLLSVKAAAEVVKDVFSPELSFPLFQNKTMKVFSPEASGSVPSTFWSH